MPFSTPQRLPQPATHSTSSTRTDDWGHPFGRPPENCLRIGAQNIGPQPRRANSEKTRQLMNFWSAHKFDIFLFSEHSLALQRLNPKDSWQSRVHTKFKKASSSVAYNHYEQP